MSCDLGVFSKAILWIYHPLENGEFTVKVRLTREKDVKYIKLPFSSSLANWDEKADRPLPSHPAFLELSAKIKSTLEEIDLQVKLAERKDEQFLTMSELRRRVENKKVPKQAAQRPYRVMEYFDLVINKYKVAGNTSYQKVFEHARSVMAKFLEGRDPYFQEFIPEMVKEFGQYMKDTYKVKGTFSNYLRTIYRVWNIAIEQGHLSEHLHPKKYVQLHPYKRIKTAKRAIDRKSIISLETAEANEKKRIFRSQQYFMFMYYCRGLEFADLANLKKTDIHGSFLRYKREKTGKILEFKLHSKAMDIIRFFSRYELQSDDGHVFPILFARHNTPEKVFHRIHDSIGRVNKDLRILTSTTDTPRKVTTKVAKHSLASNLRAAGVDIGIIRAVLGHETEEQTRTYLSEITDYHVSETMEDILG